MRLIRRDEMRMSTAFESELRRGDKLIAADRLGVKGRKGVQDVPSYPEIPLSISKSISSIPLPVHSCYATCYTSSLPHVISPLSNKYPLGNLNPLPSISPCSYVIERQMC